MTLAKMLLVSCGFTPKQIDTEFSWKEIEQFLAVLPAVQRMNGSIGGF